MQNIKIIAEADKNHPYIIIDKPAGLPSAPLSEDDENNAFFQAKKIYPFLSSVCGKKECEHGLLHRLDTRTSGLIAASQEFYDYMNEEQRAGRFIKYYSAVCNYYPENAANAENADGFPPFPYEKNFSSESSFVISSFFRHYGEGRRAVRPVTKASGAAALKKIGQQKEYSTEILSIKALENPEAENRCLVECRIAEGFKHQVRCHLAWAGLPVCGDELYNFKDKKNAEKLMFSASKITFEYPRGDLNSYDRKDTWT